MKQEVYKLGELGEFKGDDKIFTGDVNVKMMFLPSEYAPYSAGLVTFKKCSRSAWHTHPAGQNLIVTKGIAITKAKGQKAQIARVGEAIVCPPNIEHWHGATSLEDMSHIALTMEKDGKNVTWLDKVTDEEYNQALEEIKDLL